MKKKIRIAFFGAPRFAAHVLESMLKDSELPVDVVCVITQPDRPAGRKQIITPTPVKRVAQDHNIPVYTSDDAIHIAEVLKNCDLALLYAYGEILPEQIVKIPTWGFWNIHPSILPKYRGTSPIAYTLLMGDMQTGVSLMEMDSKMDHGPIIDQKTYVIDRKDTREILENRLSDIGYELFKINVQLLIDGTLEKKEQNHQERTFTRLLTKQDGFLPFAVFTKIVHGDDLTKGDTPAIISDYQKKYPQETPRTPSEAIFDCFRGLSPWPGMWTLIRLHAPEGQVGIEKRLKITGMELCDGKPVITLVQLEGKKEVPLSTFLTAYSL
jgi:methionyl-tRNA formyltransferase